MQGLIDIGTGIYMPSDIAQILGIDVNKVRRWLNNYFSEHIEKENGQIFTNFWAMIDLYVFNTLIEKGIKRRYVKQLYDFMKQKLNLEYPFATNKVYVLNKQLYTELNDFIIDGQIAGVIKEFVVPFWEKVEFENDIAQKYYPLGKDRYIVVDPEIQFERASVVNAAKRRRNEKTS